MYLLLQVHKRRLQALAASVPNVTSADDITKYALAQYGAAKILTYIESLIDIPETATKRLAGARPHDSQSMIDDLLGDFA